MNKETGKIAQACFVGGVLCTATAFCLAPMFWWLGMLAGIAGGVLGYEFRTVLRAIPRAWRAAQLEMDSRLPKMIWAIGNFLRRPHPFGYLSLVITITITIFHVVPTVNTNMIFRSLLFGLMWFTSWILVFLVAEVGVSKERGSFVNSLIIIEGKEVRLTYGNAIRWTAEGLGLIILFPVWIMWKCLFIGIKHAGIFTARFLKHLFILIHSDKRVLCAIDGTLGGAVAFLWLAPTAQTLASKAAVVIFGGLLGAGLGAINYEVVSKRLLHVVPR